MNISDQDLKAMLDAAVLKYNIPDFIPNDPISIPHSYTKLQDIEITAFWTSILAWGQRVTIINKSKELYQLMDNAPYDFILNHEEKDRKAFEHFKHRTFNYTDTLYFLDFLQRLYQSYETLEEAFLENSKFISVGSSLTHFRKYFFDHENAPLRTQKHIASPAKKSTCKRLNMFLRWMVRKDNCNVDFGLWKKIPMSELMMPFDVHVERIGRNLGLITRKQRDWTTVIELTENLKRFDASDPVKYDFALFGMGVDSDI